MPSGHLWIPVLISCIFVSLHTGSLTFWDLNFNLKNMKADIKDLADIIVFVDEFYIKVKNDEVLGPVFNNVIQDWGPHLDKMYKFWNAALFGVPGFKGNPFARHAPLPIGADHFNRWLDLFKSTIDEHFEGPIALDAKNRAKLMAAMFLSRLQNMRESSDRVIV